VLLMCRRMGIDYQLDDRRRCLPPVDFDFRGELRAFQEAAVEQMLARDFGTLSAPTGSGKTVMALYMVARRRQPALVIVHTKDLAAQWVERIEAFLGIPSAECGMIAGGRIRIGSRISVALVQSLYKCAEEVSQHIGFVVADECHRCPSRTFTEAVIHFDARFMLGLSATPWRRDNLSRLIFWHLGDVHHEVDKAGLVAAGEVLPAEVIVRATRFRPFHDPVNEYSKMLSELTGDTERNLLIAQDVADEVRERSGIALVLSDRRAHCENLQALLRYRFKVDSELMTGEMTLPERQEVVERMNAGKVRVVIATGRPYRAADC
jgi:superfamily II DNA or RNA helicase